jgi:hypothetical protein
MLAIALEDPDVRSPCGYFGKLTGASKGAADLRFNLGRILKVKGSIPPIVVEPAPRPFMEVPGGEDPKWIALAGALKRIIREGKFGSWFSRVGFHGLTDGVLMLSTPTGIAADKIKADFIPDILAAAQAVDLFVEKVSITLRRDGGG